MALVKDPLHLGVFYKKEGDSFGDRVRAHNTGDVAQTQLARVDVILTRIGDDTYEVFVRASFARYLVDWLTDALVGIEGAAT